MSKKITFKQIISDFIERPLPTVVHRAIELPLDIPKVISLLGSRRAGKTYILFQTIEQLRATIPADRLVYLNFEDDRLFPLGLEDMEVFTQAYYELYPSNKDEKVWFFFDEIQEVPHWEKYVRRLSDTEQCRIYITGSSSKLLSRELATSLRGRTLSFEVFPLSYSEFLHFKDVQINAETSKGQAHALHQFDAWLQQGGYPELIFIPENQHRSVISEYLDLMLYRDITERFGVKQPAVLKYLLKYYLQNIANPTSVARVFNDLKSQGYSISKNTLFDYIDHIQEAYLLYKVDIWSRSVRVQAVNPSKYYCIDVAFKHVVSNNPDHGRLLENVVFMHLRRYGIVPSYLMGKQEVDFYWENGTPINVCADMTAIDTRNREVKGMLEALETYQLDYGLIITRDHAEEIKIDEKTISIIPAWRYLLNPPA